MKRLFSVIALAVVAALALAGCGNAADNASNAVAPATSKLSSTTRTSRSPSR